MTGLVAAFGLLAGVMSARASGQGMDVDTSLFDVALHNLNYPGTWYLNGGTVTGRTARSGHPSLVPSQLYRTGDGWIFVMCNKEKFWKTFAREIGKPEWADNEEFGSYKARLANRERLTQALDEVLSTATTDEWVRKLAGTVPVAPVYDVAQALENPFVQEQERVMTAPHPVRGSIRTPACPIRCPGATERVGIAPQLGEHTREIMRGLGYDDARIAALSADKAI
jgi:succinate---hydroxymethylglutarate CoA-transferase